MYALPANTTLTVRGTDLILERHFRAPITAVWDAWTDPAQLGRWFGPAAYHNEEVLIDAREGGTWRIVMVGPDGTRYPWHGRVLEVEAPHRLALEMLTDEHPAAWQEMVAAATGRSASSPLESVVLVELSAVGDGTQMRLTQRFTTPEEASGHHRLGAEGGWSEGNDRLELTLAGLATPPDVIVLSRTIRAPRDRVWAAFSNADALDSWWGPDGFVTKTQSHSLEMGGSWVFTMTHPQWGTFPNRALWLDIKAPERLHFRHDGGEGTDGFLSWIWLEDLRDGTTRITLCQRHPSAEAVARAHAMGAVKLGYQTLSHLADKVEAEQTAS